MGLFSKKPPCAICGGKVEFLLPMKIGDEYVCGDCAAKIDLPDDKRENLTMSGLREYLNYYEENRVLTEQFCISQQVSLGAFKGDCVFDFENRLFCMSADLSKLIFRGDMVRSFTISEDYHVIFEGRADGLRCNESNTLEKARMMSTQAALVRMQNRKNGTNNSRMEFPEPFKKFIISIKMNQHPYYQEIRIERGAPTIIDSDPDIPEYIREYEEDFYQVQELADALMCVAFPDACS